MKKPLILIGGGGHCKSCIDVIEAEGKYIIKGILDTKDKVGTVVLNYPIVDTDECINKYIELGYEFLITIGQIKSGHHRKKIFDVLEQKKASLATVIAPSAVVSNHAKLGKGTIVMHNVNVNAGAIIGSNVILNTACLVEHDVVVGNHVHLSTHAILNGGVVIDNSCFIGSNAVVVQEVRIVAEAIVGAGSVVTSKINKKGIYVGNPARLK